MDPVFTRNRPGSIEVICGCMYSGKTEELIRQMRRCEYAKLDSLSFKPRIDSRYSESEIVSHNKDAMDAIVIDKASEIFLHLRHETQVVGIDEAQFFDKDIVGVVTKLANKGVRVIIAGLDTDWRGEPFGPMPELLAVADIVKKQYAICVQCGEAATRTQRLVKNESEVLVGSFHLYEARCRSHFDPTLAQASKPLQEHRAE